MNYCLIDKSDPNDFLECEGEVLKTFFASSGLFNKKQSLELIRGNQNVENGLKKNRNNYFNIVQFSAHGTFKPQTKNSLEYSAIVQRRWNKKDVEIFRPDSIVRTGLQADLFFSTNCQTFNPLFIDVLKHYKGVSNFIAPVNSPYIGNTLIFTMMFYNFLFRRVNLNASRIKDEIIEETFHIAKYAYKQYSAKDDFRLFNSNSQKTIR